jgi:branched-chain amino acid transport system substrate-binding protein
MLKKWIYALIAMVCLVPLTVHSVAAAECQPATGEPLRLGAIFPKGTLLTALTGEYYQGADMMRQTINACGGVNGRPVEWVYEAASTRRAAEAAATRLIKEEQVPLIVGSGSPAVNEGASAVAEALGVVYWEVTEAVDKSGQWVLSPRPTNAQLGEGAAAYARAQFGDDPKVALIYENRPRGQAAASGVRGALKSAPLIEFKYADNLYDGYKLAVDIREGKIDVVILAAFDDDGQRMWYALRQADANIKAWIHIGSAGYRPDLCQRFGNIEAFVSVDAAGQVNPDYRARLTDVYDAYRKAYLAAFSYQTHERSDLSAAGVYVLLHEALPKVTGAYTATAIRDALLQLDKADPIGLMGEGLSFDPNTHVNRRAGVIVEQAQDGGFCPVWPGAIASCKPLAFPTWRERALASEKGVFCRPRA